MALQHHFQTTNNEGIPLPATATAAGTKWAQDVNLVAPDGTALGTAANPLRAIIESVVAVEEVTVTNFPANQDVTVTNFPANQDVSVTNQRDNIAVNNFPANQDVTVTNIPANQDVTVTNLPANQAVTVTNDPSVMNGTVLDAIIAIPAGTVVKAQATATPLANRRLLILAGGSEGLSYGYTQTSQGFTLYRDEIVELPIGPNITVWVKSTTLPGQITVAELN